MFADQLPPWVNTASPRVGAGLGTIARIVASGETIYRGKLCFAEAERRVHSSGSHSMSAGGDDLRHKAMFGACLLVDCHSMPSTRSGRPGGKADFVLGDAHGTACNPLVTHFIERTLTDLGYAVRRNDPYAGGYITRHYGRPRESVHVVQLEIARELYMDEARIERLPRFASVQQDMTALIDAIARAAPALLTR